jgi:hypothetical protein
MNIWVTMPVLNPKLHKKPHKDTLLDLVNVLPNPYMYLYSSPKILTTMKEILQTFCATTYVRSGVNLMWILKNTKELLTNLKSRNFSHINNTKTYDFSTIYTTIPHDKLKTKLFEIINSCFSNKNGKKEIFIFSDQSPT